MTLRSCHTPSPLHEGAGIEPCQGRFCVINASGMGRRMGGPKALLLWDTNLPLAVAHAQTRALDCQGTLVVTRQPIAESLSCFSHLLSLVASDCPDDWGPAGSLHALVRSGKIASAEQLLISPVDMPPISPVTVQSLASRLVAAVDAVRPLFGSRGGHPVLVRASLILEHYRFHAPPLRDVLRSLGPRLVNLPVDDPDVIADLDTPEAFRCRMGRTPTFWSP